MPVPTIYWQNDKVYLIDQTQLPFKLIHLEIEDYRKLCHAIKELKVRGAPAIGIAGAFGVVLGLQKLTGVSTQNFINAGEQVIAELAATRPTAVNLFWALERMRSILHARRAKSIDTIKNELLQEALAILEEDKAVCRAIGRNGASLIHDGFTVLTHCNAGGLATADYGTALGVIYTAVAQGKEVKVYADETRPLLQGARLTAWELMHENIDVTLICDNMAASVMAQGKINLVLVGADRIASNGDAANKIGTYNLAVLAHYHHIPFYIVAPLSTVDLKIQSGKEIPIEERAPNEVTDGFGSRTAPYNVKVYNPAFDVTPHQLITAIVTEHSVVYPPFEDTLKKIKKNS